MVSSSSALPGRHGSPWVVDLHLFNGQARAFWTAVVVLTIFSEVVPLPALTPAPFVLYCIAKAVLFFLDGYVAPLAFWRFNALNRGLFLSVLSATAVETLQGILGHGHSFHWYELLIKLILVFVGFAMALDARYECRVKAGPLLFRLHYPDDAKAPLP